MRLRVCSGLFGDWGTFADFEQPRLNELRSEQWQLCMTIGLALQPPHEAAVKIGRVRLGEQFVERLSSDKVGIHSAGVLRRVVEQSRCQLQFRPDVRTNGRDRSAGKSAVASSALPPDAPVAKNDRG